MNTNQIIILARKHCDTGAMASSARLCLASAIEAQNNGDYNTAKAWAVKSLKYSVGIFHKDYQKAAA